MIKYSALALGVNIYFMMKITGMTGTIVRTSTTNNALFRRVTVGYTFKLAELIKTIDTDLPGCALSCLRESVCLSFNIEKSKKICKLLSVDRNTVGDGDSFVANPGWDYYDTGFNITLDSWRKKSLLNLECPANNPCGRCGCIKEPGKATYHCDCWTLRGKIIHNGYCWMPKGNGCKARSGKAIMYTTNCTNPATDFEFNPDTGELWHVCTGMKVCTYDNQYGSGEYIRLRSSCVASTNANKWIRTSGNALQYGPRCVHPVTTPVSEGTLAPLRVTCYGSQSTLRFSHEVMGRVKIEVWAGVSSFSNFLQKTNKPPNRSGWLYNFETALYRTEIENVGRRLRAYFISPETGDHEIIVAVNSYVHVYLGDNVSNKIMIINFSEALYWYKYKRAGQRQMISLVSGKKNYIEVLSYDDLDRDYVCLGVTLPSGKHINPITQKYLVAIE